MMNWLVSTSLRLRVLVLALSIVLMIVGVRTAQRGAAGRLPRVRAAAGRDPDRGAGPVDRGGREPDQRAAGERAQRHDRAEDDPVEVGAGAVVGRADPQGGDRPDGVRGRWCRSGWRSRRRRLPAAARAAGDPLAAVVDQPAAQDRRLVEDALADGPDDPGQVDDPPPPDGDPRRGQRRDLGPARPAVPGAGRSRPAPARTA